MGHEFEQKQSEGRREEFSALWVIPSGIPEPLWPDPLLLNWERVSDPQTENRMVFHNNAAQPRGSCKIEQKEVCDTGPYLYHKRAWARLGGHYAG